ncbi:hypothetical protein WJX79_007770 [Trebouxia sp. C0005]
MDASVSRQLARTAEFTGKTLGKADVADPGLLQTALLMSNLSNAVYIPNELIHWESDVVRQALCVVSQQISSFKPLLKHAHPASDTGPFEDSGRQYGIWDVEGLGVVVAFGGTQDPIDILVNLNFETHQLTAGSFDVHLHAGVYRAAKLCCSDIASQCIKLCRKPDGEVLPLFLTGHSLGGALALCAFVELVAAAPDIRLSLAYGGVFTFGAPAVVHTGTDVKALAYLAQQLTGFAQVSSRLPIHCFVNDLDIVPRLLESSQVTSWSPVVQLMLPKRTRTIQTKASSGGSFRSIGATYLLLNDSIKVFDSQSEQHQLKRTVELAYQSATGCSSKIALSGMIQRCYQDHSIEKYVSKLQAAVQHTVPVLFMGGSTDDYEAVPIKRLSAATGTLSPETSLRHKATGMVSHSAFCRLSDGTADCGAPLIHAHYPEGTQPTAGFSPQSQHLNMSYDGVVQGPVATAQPAQSKLAKLANMANTPLGKVAIGALGVTAGLVVAPVLAVGSALTAPLNLGLAGFNVYQCWSMSNKLDQYDRKLSVIVKCGANTQEQVQRISDQVHDSSARTLEAVGQVSNQCVMKHCENIQAGQSEIIAKQEELMDKLNSIDAKVDAIYMSIKATPMQVFREMNCWAAVCVDAANASLNGFERDVRNERTKAAIAVKGDIISLLKHSSLYLLATSYGGALAKLVYLHRAMHSSADIAHMLGSNEEHMPASITIHSLSDSEDVYVSAVQVIDLLAPLGIPTAHQQAVMEKLDAADVPLLQQVALGDFTTNIVDIIDCQLSGLGVRELYQQQQLFAFEKSAAQESTEAGWTESNRLVMPEGIIEPAASAEEDYSGEQEDDSGEGEDDSGEEEVTEMPANLSYCWGETQDDAHDNSPQSQGGRSSKPKRSELCFNCGETGHWSRSCPLPQKKGARVG